jgi:hypothetical protein
MLILSFYSFMICLVAVVLYGAVNKLEPNRRHASVLKILIVTPGYRGNPHSFDAIASA